ncbi:ANK3 [Symbiodinium microadriaticum]|nr:ANK3 [Symbiodinium microadriaticum]CAE7821606.1 ANK3 [Symbiodinium sp. KB8]
MVLAVLLCLSVPRARAEALVLPAIENVAFSNPDDVHRALSPAWEVLVEQRNAAGLVPASEEGQSQQPMSREEAAFQYRRVQDGQVDSARLLLVFGLVPSARHLDPSTAELFRWERDSSKSSGSGQQLATSALQRYADGSTPLHLAATFGLSESLEALLRAGADVHATSDSGVLPIHASAIAGHRHSLDLLVKARADPNSPHGFAGNSAMHFAAEMGHSEVVRRLCELRANVEASKAQGGTALHTAADTNNSAVVQALLSEPCSCDPEALLLGDTPALYLAASRGFPDVIEALLAGGASPDRTLRQRQRVGSGGKGSKDPSTASANLPGSRKDMPGFEEANGATPLHAACENGHLLAVQALLGGGSRQLATMEGVTPLITALQYRQRAIARVLLESRTPANVHVVSPADGQTALHIAAAYGFSEVVAGILRHGGASDVQDAAGHTPMDYARDRLVLWLLNRFHGRDGLLDDIVRRNVLNGLEEIISSIDETKAPTFKKDLYKKYLRANEEGLLRKLSSDLVTQARAGTSEALQHLAVARFILAGASDVPVAIEALLHRSEASLWSALTLLGIPVRDLHYVPGKELLLNGRDVHHVMQEMLSVTQAVQSLDLTIIEPLLHELRSTSEPSSTEHQDHHLDLCLRAVKLYWVGCQPLNKQHATKPRRQELGNCRHLAITEKPYVVGFCGCMVRYKTRRSSPEASKWRSDRRAEGGSHGADRDSRTPQRSRQSSRDRSHVRSEGCGRVVLRAREASRSRSDSRRALALSPSVPRPRRRRPGVPRSNSEGGRRDRSRLRGQSAEPVRAAKARKRALPRAGEKTRAPLPDRPDRKLDRLDRELEPSRERSGRASDSRESRDRERSARDRQQKEYMQMAAQQDARRSSQARMERIFYKMLDTQSGSPVESVEVLRDLELLMTEHGETAELRHVPEEARAFASFASATSELPFPCLPGILGTELLQLLWLAGLGNQKDQALELLLESHRHFTFLRVTPWTSLLQLGYGLNFALGQMSCAAIPAPENDAAAAAEHFHGSWPGSLPTEATIFKQFHVLVGFDYRRCARRFLGEDRDRALASCAPPRKRRGRRPGPGAFGSAWPHRQLVLLAARQPWACGLACRWAVAFASLAQAVRDGSGSNRPRALSEDQRKLVQAAQDELQQVEAAVWSLDGRDQVKASCSLSRAYPVWALLAWLGLGTLSKLEGRLPVDSSMPQRSPNQPPPPTLAKLCDRVQWPLAQSLTAQGTLAVYFLVKTVGGLLDEFGVKWWMSSGGLLGAMRNGGILPQDCDVDIAVWRPDAHQMVRIPFRTALAAAGIAMYHMPIYLQYRFCLLQVPAAADLRSVDGGLACHLPYIDAHLADRSSASDWHYIHRTELRYAKSFPLTGLLGPAGEDRRERRLFGSVHIWTIREKEAEQYLSSLYGHDWKTTLRGRYGQLVHNSSEGFYSLIARPTGPLRDVIQEQRLVGNLLPGAAGDCRVDCDLS